MLSIDLKYYLYIKIFVIQKSCFKSSVMTLVWGWDLSIPMANQSEFSHNHFPSLGFQPPFSQHLRQINPSLGFLWVRKKKLNYLHLESGHALRSKFFLNQSLPPHLGSTSSLGFHSWFPPPLGRVNPSLGSISWHPKKSPSQTSRAWIGKRNSIIWNQVQIE